MATRHRGDVTAPGQTTSHLTQLCVVLGEQDRAAHLDAAERICELENLVVHRARVALYRAWALRDAREAVDARPVLAAADASACSGVAREARPGTRDQRRRGGD